MDRKISQCAQLRVDAVIDAEVFRVRISLQWPGWDDFGITPNRLIWNSDMEFESIGPATLPACTSCVIYSCTTSGLARAEGMFSFAGRRWYLTYWYPIQNPC